MNISAFFPACSKTQGVGRELTAACLEAAGHRFEWPHVRGRVSLSARQAAHGQCTHRQRMGLMHNLGCQNPFMAGYWKGKHSSLGSASAHDSLLVPSTIKCVGERKKAFQPAPLHGQSRATSASTKLSTNLGLCLPRPFLHVCGPDSPPFFMLSNFQWGNNLPLWPLPAPHPKPAAA